MFDPGDWPEECTMVCQKCGERLLLWDAEGKPHLALPIPVTCTPCSLKEVPYAN